MTLVGLLVYVQQELTLRLNAPRLDSIVPSGLGVLVVMLAAGFLLIRLAGQRLAIARRHLLILYVMLAVGLPLGALGGATAMTGSIGRYVFIAGDAGREGNLWYYPIYKALPLELWPGEHGSPEIVQFNRGGTQAVPWEKWERPLLLWSTLFAGIILCMVGLGILLRHRWLVKEFLPCPLNEVPNWFFGFAERRSTDLDASSPGEEPTLTASPGVSLWRNRALWIGFSIPAVIFLNNGLAHYVPQFFQPMPLFTDLGRLFAEEPLKAMNRSSGGPIPFPAPGLQITLIPALVAVAFFLPKEISLSVVVFYVLGRLLTAFFGAVQVKWGIPLYSNSGFLAYFHQDRMPSLYSLGVGALIFIAMVRSLQLLVGFIRDRSSVTADFWPGLLLFLAGGATAVGWLCWFGVPLYLALFTFVATICLTVAFTRLRVEGGIPLLFGVPPVAAILVTMNLTPFTEPYGIAPGQEQQAVSEISDEARTKYEQWKAEQAVASDAGTFDQAPITVAQYCAFLNEGGRDGFWSEPDHGHLIHRRPEAYRILAGLGVLVLFSYLAILTIPAIMLEGFHMAERAHLSHGHVVLATTLAIVVAFVVAVPASLRQYYEVGLDNLTVPNTAGSHINLLMRTWELQFNEGMNHWGGATKLHTDWVRVVAMSAGFVVSAVLSVLRSMSANFPLVPIGFVVASMYGSWCWGSILVGYIAKTMVLRFGGPTLYASSKPFFVGMFCGHVLSMLVWTIVAWQNDQFMNGFNHAIEPGLGAGAVF